MMRRRQQEWEGKGPWHVCERRDVEGDQVDRRCTRGGQQVSGMRLGKGTVILAEPRAQPTHPGQLYISKFGAQNLHSI